MRSCPTVGGWDLTSPGASAVAPQVVGDGRGPPAAMHPKGPPGSRSAQSGGSVGGCSAGTFDSPGHLFTSHVLPSSFATFNLGGAPWGLGSCLGPSLRPAMNPGGHLCSVPLVLPGLRASVLAPLPPGIRVPLGSSPCPLLCLSARVLPVPAHPQLSPCLPISISLGATSLYLSPWIC